MSSLSPSLKSNGARLISATHLIKKTGKIKYSNKVKKEVVKIFIVFKKIKKQIIKKIREIS